ncbi:MAG: leucine-rich repeat protein, partial [Clostridia bacterium]|nr:leucine-rich repeat protein [Clostridia bacterium]
MSMSEDFQIENGVLKRYSGEEEEVIVPDEVTAIDERAFAFNEQLRKVVLPAGMLRIGSGAFYDCRQLTEIIIPEGIVEIGNNAFAGCVRLERIDLPQTLTRIGDGAFYCCGALCSVVLPPMITCIEDHTFNRCTALRNVVLPAGLTHIGAWAFLRCKELEHIILPDGLQSIGEGAFHTCTSLREIVVPDGVTRLEPSIFSTCKSLSRAVLPKGIGPLSPWMFWACPALADAKGFVIVNGTLFDYYGSRKSVTVPDGVTHIGRTAFYHRKSVTTIILPDSVQFIGNNAFAGPKELTLRFNGNADSEIGAFNGVKKLETPNLSIAAFHSTQEKRLAIQHWFADGAQHTDRAVWPVYCKYAMGQRKRLLAMAFQADWVAVPMFYATQGKITVANFEPEYLNPALEAGASECIAFLMDWKARHISEEEAARYEERKLERELMKDPFNAGDMKKLWDYRTREDGTVMITAYKGEETDIVVPMRIGRRSVTAVGEHAFAINDERKHPRPRERQNVLQRIRTVTLDEGITHIGSGAFLGCTGLTQIVL